MRFFGKIFYVFQTIILLGLFFILQKASVAGVIFPFAFSMAFALIWANQKWFVVAPAFLVGSILSDWSVAGIVSALITTVVLVIPYLSHILAKKPMQIWEMPIFAILSQAGYIGFAAAAGGYGAIYAAISAVLGGIIMLGFIKLFEALFVRGFSWRLSVIELVSGGIILLAIAGGLVELELEHFSFLKLFVSFMLLAITYCSKNYYAIFIAALFGFGSLLSSLNPVFFAPFMLWSLAISPFKTYRKYFSAIALVLSELAIGFYFKLYYSFDWLSILPTAISALVFMIIPDKIYNTVKAVFDIKGERTAIKSVVNQNRELLHRRLHSLGDVFGDMERVFRSLVKKNLSQEEVKVLLRDEIISQNCATCPDRARCHRARAEDTTKVLDQVANIAFEKGRVTLLDIPSYLSSNCGRVNGIISSAANLSRQYKSYSGMLSNIDNSKLLIADQFKGISLVMKSLSDETAASVAFDANRESKIKEELLFNDIVCTDVVVYEKGASIMEVTLVVRNSDSDKLTISDIVSRVCKCKMTIFEKLPTSRPGFSTITLKTSPKYDCIFALAQTPKTGSQKSGDSHSVLRLDGDKFMFAICDGMGSGVDAENTSSVAISLIENFYKAGFDSDLVLSSVNKLLSLQKEDKFSALDVIVLDLKSGLGDFIKMGAPCGFIVGEEEIKKIDSGALPLGIVDKFNPVTKKMVISSGDILLLFSDGIADAFASDEKLRDYIVECYNPNPQTVADKLLEGALASSDGRALDDMTVLAIKVFDI